MANSRSGQAVFKEHVLQCRARAKCCPRMRQLCVGGLRSLPLPGVSLLLSL